MPPDPPPRKPPWLRRRLPPAGGVAGLEAQLARQGLGTICQEGRCPNRAECFGRGVATFLVMGSVCTRNCGFCAVATGRPAPLDPEEPERLARQVAAMGLQFVVITSVTRDDLPDGGAAHLARVVRALRGQCLGVGVELLVPDFRGSAAALATLLESRPQVLAHNLETVERLSPALRPAAGFRRSLELLARVKQINPAQLSKSGLMLGLGEEPREVLAALQQLRAVGCDLLTLGQYLSPGPGHQPVVEYVPPRAFQDYEDQARAMGFAAVASGPYVRSSYLAEHYYRLAAPLAAPAPARP
ncbi:MAG: lipoyl synthase [Pseudomonadota bacterium]